jgi:hypothetical protein
MKWVMTWLGVAFATGLLLGCGSNGSSSATAGGPKSGTTGEGETAATGSGSSPQEGPSASQEGPSVPSAYPKHAGFSAASITAGQRSQLVRSGQVTVPVQVAGSGTVSAFGQAEIDGSIVRTANAAPQATSGAGTVDLTLRLTSAAQKVLASGGSFLMYVAVRYSGSRTAQQFTLPLGPRG